MVLLIGKYSPSRNVIQHRGQYGPLTGFSLPWRNEHSILSHDQISFMVIVTVAFGIPQGSVLGTLHLLLNKVEIPLIVSRHRIGAHFYASLYTTWSGLNISDVSWANFWNVSNGQHQKLQNVCHIQETKEMFFFWRTEAGKLCYLCYKEALYNCVSHYITTRHIALNQDIWGDSKEPATKHDA